MSPSAAGGPPHTRTASGGGPVSTSNGGKANGIEGGMSTKNVWRHHDDLVAVAPDLDIHSPIDKILREGERLAKAADTSLDFRRPDIALQEYVKASIIAAEIIPRHKDFPALQSDRKDLHRVYMGLTKRIKNQDEKFMSVKKMIRENNAIYGTQPSATISTTHGPSTVLDNGTAKTLSSQANTNRSPKKNPPPIQPKPNALHGNALPQVGIHASNASQVDLATRFARLRSPQATPPIQDPRIRTQPIPIPEISNSSTGSMAPKVASTINKPDGPREMPSVPTTLPRPARISVDVDLPGLPKAPDAIYSPARGTENAAIVNLPSSIARNNSYLGNGRKNSAPPISTVGPTPGVVDNRTDYFSQVQKAEPTTQSRKSSNEQQVVLPKKTNLTAEELMGYLRQGSHTTKILIVDLRSREDFDNGHIMSQFIICVEPITLRHGISGDELADSMVIAPDVEQRAFELRHTFDLVVFYDQSSTSTNPSTPTEASKKLHDFVCAVYDYGYEKRLKQSPVFLIGGLDAWVDLLGPSSLETSSTGKTLKSTVPNGGKRARPLNDISQPRNSYSSSLARRTKYQSRPLSKEEEKMWESAMQQEKENVDLAAAEGSTPDEIVYARTTEDFFRRYPELPSIQESMTSPAVQASVHPLEAELSSTMARPPARPPPAIPRQRSSGISEKGTMAPYANASVNATSITTLRQPRGLTGINNPGTLCYMNAIIQGLSATPWLRSLLDEKPPPVPKKSSESSDPPQLMVKCFQNLISHLWCGQWDFVNPKTFRDYVYAVHGKTISVRSRDNARVDIFGGGRQHDASEFLVFLLGILDDELNPFRDQPSPGEVPIDLIKDFTNSNNTIVEAASRWWAFQMSHENSPITQRMKGLTCRKIICANCHKPTMHFQQVNTLDLNFPTGHVGPISINDMIDFNFGKGSETELEVPRECDFCSSAQPGQQPVRYSGTFRDYFVYWPDTLIININRYRYKDDGTRIKILNLLHFPERLDFSQWKINEPSSKNVDPRSTCDPVYDVYGCVIHLGNSLEGGHYTIHARSPDLRKGSGGAGDWHYFNDSRVRPSSFGETQRREDKTTTTTMLFCRRRQ